MMLAVCIYLSAINLLAFWIFSVDYKIYSQRGKGIKPAVLCNVVTILGGSLGALIAEFVWDPRVQKINALSRLYTIAWLFIHLSFVYAVLGPKHEIILQRVSAFYGQNKLLIWGLIILNIVTFLVYAIDKVNAIYEKGRIREVVLLGLAAIGGAVGALLAMDLLNHKVKSMHFIIGVPLILCAHLFLFMIELIGVAP